MSRNIFFLMSLIVGATLLQACGVKGAPAPLLPTMQSRIQPAAKPSASPTAAPQPAP